MDVSPLASLQSHAAVHFSWPPATAALIRLPSACEQGSRDCAVCGDPPCDQPASCLCQWCSEQCEKRICANCLCMQQFELAPSNECTPGWSDRIVPQRFPLWPSCICCLLSSYRVPRELTCSYMQLTQQGGGVLHVTGQEE